MKKNLLKGSILVLGIILLTGCDLFKQKNENTKPVKEKEIEVSFNYQDISTMKKISELAFIEEKESLKETEFSEEHKSEIARFLSGGVDKTGKEMLSLYQKYFGKDKKIEFQNVICNMEHPEEEKAIYIFDKDKDQYIYNEKHPGHGGGGTYFIGSEIVLENLKYKGNEYVYEAKILFYGNALCHDIGGCDYGKGYKSYEDAKNGTNALLDIDNTRIYWNEYELPTLQMDKLINDYRDKLDTYEFHFIKEDNNIIFTSYNKK